MDDQQLLDLMQVTDRSFPTGAYVHSGGLEWLLARQATDEGAALGPGDGTDPAPPFGAGSEQSSIGTTACYGRIDLDAALRLRLDHQLARFELVFVLAAFEHPPEVLDRRFHAMCLPKEAREASSQIGRSLLRQAADLFDAPSLETFRERAPFAHQPIVFGLVGQAIGVEPRMAASAYAFQALRGQVSVAQRVARLGQSDAQRILHGLKPDVLAAVSVAESLPIDEVAPFMPILDIAAMAHERSPVRLFVS
jgi:urease accessory protein